MSGDNSVGLFFLMVPVAGYSCDDVDPSGNIGEIATPKVLEAVVEISPDVEPPPPLTSSALVDLCEDAEASDSATATAALSLAATHLCRASDADVVDAFCRLAAAKPASLGPALVALLGPGGGAHAGELASRVAAAAAPLLPPAGRGGLAMEVAGGVAAVSEQSVDVLASLLPAAAGVPTTAALELATRLAAAAAAQGPSGSALRTSGRFAAALAALAAVGGEAVVPTVVGAARQCTSGRAKLLVAQLAG